MQTVDTSHLPRTSGKGTLTRAHGLHVLSVSGSFYEMGRQHGALLADDVRRGPIPYYRTFLQKIARGAAPGVLGRVARRALQETVGRRIAEAMPDFALETIRGVADGAGLPYAEVLEGCTMPDQLVWLASRIIGLERVPPAVRHRLSLGLGCTSAIAWGGATRDGMLYHARNLDYHGVSCWPSTSTVAFHRPERGQRYVSCTAAGVALGGFTAMNEAGLTLTVHQHMFTHRAALGGTPIATVGDLVMREATCLADAEAILARHRPIGCWTYLVADGNAKEVLCWEEDPTRHVAHRYAAEGTFGYANIYLDPELGASERDLFPTYWRHNQGRYARANELLSAGRGALDAHAMAAILGDVGDPRCRLRDSIAMTLTVGSVVFRPEDGIFWVGTGEAPTSHGTFVPFSLRTGGLAPDVAPLDPGASIDPRARDAFEHWRRAYVAWTDHESVPEARKALTMACLAAPDQPAYHAVAGMFALKDGDAREATRMLDAAIGLGHPDEERLASFHLYRGRAHDLAGDRARAESDYRAVLGRHADARVRSAAEKGLLRPYTARAARKLHVDLSLGDVMSP